MSLEDEQRRRLIVGHQEELRARQRIISENQTRAAELEAILDMYGAKPIGAK
jgi:hypothetical protein